MITLLPNSNQLGSPANTSSCELSSTSSRLDPHPDRIFDQKQLLPKLSSLHLPSPIFQSCGLHEHQVLMMKGKLLFALLTQSFMMWIPQKSASKVGRLKKLLKKLLKNMKIKKLLEDGGMGGGGKTTLARAVFDRISYQFEGKAFVENVREVSKSSLYGLNKLQGQILCSVLHENIPKTLLRGRKVLILLDDVDDIEQLEVLADDVDDREQLEVLADIPIEGYEELSKQVVEYADGLPLTIKVLEMTTLMETRIEAFLSSLELDAHEVRMIGIWGMGGGGKTTLARAVFDRISYQFEGKAFVENVREVSKSSLYGLNKLQGQILCRVVHENIPVRSVHEGTNMMKTLLRGRKVLILLDDVDDREQLEVLADIPIEGYEELSKQVVEYADGLPLTIKVLGSLLCGQNEHQWMYTLERLKRIPLKATMEKLELSYIDPEEDYKDIFLDVACLLKYRELEMHDHIEEMGKNIVHRVNPDKPERHSRLWIREQIEEILANDSVTPNLKELRIYQCTRLEKLHMPAETPKLTYLDFCGLQKMRTLNRGITPNLETLNVNDCCNMVELRMPAECPKLVHLDIGKLKLRTLHLGITPNLKILSADMVELRMHAEYPKLIYLDIKRLKLTTLHLGITPNLETLRLKDCADMVELRMLAECPKLVYLDISCYYFLVVEVTYDGDDICMDNGDDICMDNGDEQDGDTPDVEA
nr:hypothetical protein [Tanacetum cinerariifolium]